MNQILYLLAKENSKILLFNILELDLKEIGIKEANTPLISYFNNP